MAEYIETVDQLKEFIGNFFKEKNKPVKVILFGSRARGTNAEHSDIDIALVSEEDLEDEILELKEIIEDSLLPQKVDIIEFKKAPSKLKEEILKEGKIWIDLTV